MSYAIDRRGFALAAGASLLVPGRAQARSTWKLATGYRAESFHTANIFAMAREVDAATQGGFMIEVHPNNTLAKLNDIRAAVQSGKAEAGESILTSMVGDIPLAGADSVPFIVNSYADAKRMWRHQRPLLDKQFAQRGLTLLYAVPWPPQGLFCSKPVTGASDFKGTRMRTYNPTTARIATLLGAQGVDVPMVDVGRAFAEGRVDNMITSAVTGVENKVFGQVKYFYEINAWFPKNAVFANTKALGELAPSAREALLHAASAAEQRGWETSEKVAAESVEDLRRNGMKIERVPREFGTDLKRLGERFSLEWVRQVGPEANGIFIPYFTQA
jgi:TRAP-type C4-dicarboxylate transport system substrate-binding protein